jgi:hypothetical protein
MRPLGLMLGEQQKRGEKKGQNLLDTPFFLEKQKASMTQLNEKLDLKDDI